VAGRVARRLQQPDHAVSEEVEVVSHTSPLKACTLEVRSNIALSLRRICRAGVVELTAVDDDGCLRKMSERARVVDVQVRLHDVANRVRRDAELAQLRHAVLRLGHMHAELIREHAPVRAGISGDREWIAAVDDDITLGVADQEERHRDLDPFGLERAATE